MMRGGTAELREETGRWKGQPREERICTLCSVPEIEDVEHFLLRCGFFSEEQKALLAQMQKVGVEMDQKDDTGKIATILGVAVRRKEWEGFWRGCGTRDS